MRSITSLGLLCRYFNFRAKLFSIIDISKSMYRYYLILITGLALMRAQESSVISVGVVDFQAEGISDLEVRTLTQRFTSELNNTARAILFDREVLNNQITSAGLTVAGCKTPECILTNIGNELGAQFIITGSISKNGDRYALAAVLTDVVTQKAERVLSTNYRGPVDGMITELEIMAWEIMDLEPPESLVTKRKGKTKKKIKKPNTKSSLGALARATALPGWGHFYLDQNSRGLMFMSAEVVALATGYFAYMNYSRAYDNVDRYWGFYKESTDHTELQNYKTRTLEAEQTMLDNNNLLTVAFRAAAAIHLVNMLDAYMTEIVQKPLGSSATVGFNLDPISHQPQLRLTIALD